MQGLKIVRVLAYNHPQYHHHHHQQQQQQQQQHNFHHSNDNDVYKMMETHITQLVQLRR